MRLPLVVAFATAVYASAPGLGGSQESAAATSPAVTEAVARFDALEAASVDLTRWSEWTNDQGELGWATSGLLDSYLTMFEVTGGEKYLRKFLVLAEALAERTDARRGAVDYKGRSLVGWGATKYSRHGERVVWLVHTGMITRPLVRFAGLVKASKPLGHLAGVAERFRVLAEAALGEFEAQWRPDPITSGGYYVFERDAPLKESASWEVSLPFNQQLAAGRVFVLLWRLTGEGKYRVRAESLARHFRAHLRVDSRGAYEWDYWHGAGPGVARAREDLSHGAIDVEFVTAAVEASLVFTREDLKRFVLSLFRDSGVEHGVMRKPQDAVGLWLELAEVDCEVYRVVGPHVLAKVGRQHPQVLLGVAKAAKQARRCEAR